MIYRKLLFPIIFILLLLDCSKQSLKNRYNNIAEINILTRTIAINNEDYSYYVYLPMRYDSTKKWPVMLYLHASGANGGIDEIADGLGKALVHYPERFPMIVVFPECPFGRYWIGDMVTYAVAALDQTVKQYNGNSGRLYVSGVSMGGYGTLICGVQYPGKFAALGPVCGGVIPPFQFSQIERGQLAPHCLKILDSPDPYTELAASIAKTPVWLFHGSRDDMVPVSESRKIYAALQKNSGIVKYTEYPLMGHDIGSRVYFEMDFPAWLLSQKIAQ